MPGGARQFSMNARDTLDLPTGRESLVEAFCCGNPARGQPRGKLLAPAFDTAFLDPVVLGGQVRHNDPNERLKRDRFGDHITVIAPGITEDLGGGLEKVPDDRVITLSSRWSVPSFSIRGQNCFTCQRWISG